MKEYRLGYLVVLFVCLIALLLLGSYTLFYILIVILFVPVTMKAFLMLGLKKLHVSFGVKNSVAVTQDVGLYMQAEGTGISKGYLSHGILLVTVEAYNSLFDKNEIIQYKVSGVSDTNKIDLPFVCHQCGLVKLSIKKVQICDLLGLFNVELNAENIVQRVTVYTKKAMLKVSVQKNMHRYADGMDFDNSIKGDDSGEVSDLREYKPGDSLHSIHWKLSAKSSKGLITKEHNRPTKFDTLLYIDFGTKQNGKVLDEDSRLAIIKTGITVSEELLESGVQHCLAVPTNEKIEKFDITDISSAMSAMNVLMCIKPAETCGEWLEYMILKNMLSHYSRIVCVVWEEYPEELERLYKNIGISIVMLHGKERQMQSVNNSIFNVSAISADMIDKKEYTLVL